MNPKLDSTAPGSLARRKATPSVARYRHPAVWLLAALGVLFVSVSKVARMLAIVEAIAGLFYVAVLISRLVAIYSSPQPAADTTKPRFQTR